MEVCRQILSLGKNLPPKYFQGFFSSKPQEIASCTIANKFSQYQGSTSETFDLNPKKRSCLGFSEDLKIQHLRPLGV